MMYENLTLEPDGAVAVLTLCRPKAVNALNAATFDEFEAVLERIEGATRFAFW
jgi:enoyl-CoA hydratase